MEAQDLRALLRPASLRPYRLGMSEHETKPAGSGERAERRAARKAIGIYHEQQLLALLERVREGFARL